MLQDLNDYQQGGDPAILETLSRHVELFYRHILASPDTDDNIFDDILTSLGEAVTRIRIIQDNEETRQLVQDMTGAVAVTRGRGRPRFDITQDQLEYLLELNFTSSDIARILCVSLRTIRWRMEEYGIAVCDRYSSVSDAELDEEVARIKQGYPNAGIRLTLGMCVTFRCMWVWVCAHVGVYVCDDNACNCSVRVCLHCEHAH